jgi:hypothetical protein
MRARVLAGLVLATPLVLTPVLAPAQSELVLEPMRKGVALFQAGRYREAEPLIKEALRQSERGARARRSQHRGRAHHARQPVPAAGPL